MTGATHPSGFINRYLLTVAYVEDQNAMSAKSGVTHSTEVESALLTQLTRVQFPIFPKFFSDL